MPEPLRMINPIVIAEIEKPGNTTSELFKSSEERRPKALEAA